MRRLVLGLGLLLACGGGGDGGTGPNDSVAGSYSLRTVNGANLPYVVLQVGTDKIELTADVLTLADGGSFTQIQTYRVTENGQTRTETVPDAGSYIRNGTAITVSFNSGQTVTGSISGGTITVALSGFSYVYRK